MLYLVWPGNYFIIFLISAGVVISFETLFLSVVIGVSMKLLTVRAMSV